MSGGLLGGLVGVTVAVAFVGVACLPDRVLAERWRLAFCALVVAGLAGWALVADVGAERVSGPHEARVRYASGWGAPHPAFEVRYVYRNGWGQLVDRWQPISEGEYEERRAGGR